MSKQRVAALQVTDLGFTATVIVMPGEKVTMLVAALDGVLFEVLKKKNACFFSGVHCGCLSNSVTICDVQVECSAGPAAPSPALSILSCHTTCKCFAA
jgi:hypothetical protein